MRHDGLRIGPLRGDRWAGSRQPPAARCGGQWVNASAMSLCQYATAALSSLHAARHEWIAE